MSLTMYLGEVQSQTHSMNAVCSATIQGMEQAIHLPEGTKQTIIIDTRGQTVSSDILREIRAEIHKKANTLPEIKFIKKD
ncbi:hypothetical protein COD90_06075 [Bacillus cereus]|uniref:hypothetical protein n=1 Tax=Bacillus sp. OE TaxID=2293320 RepID=UPI00032FF537|nr:hypothetical protein KQ1_04482 [Bacillus cereus BAG3O-1]PFF86241.1 hypothetical protein CN338_16790 [Bacillus cereus]PGW19255.1 hypothetical protein COD90_06075 [Bacillus cereus]RFB10709.1 hypothetical protein DZB88_21595 [Bacillus sp. OE]SCV22528.1 Uncharacterized protein BCRIVMBC845_05089 [Bacillus cereus]